jgi:hypothetical protein
MIYGELWIKPISIQIHSRVLCYWSKLSFRSDKICKIVYSTAQALHPNNICKFPCINFVKNTLDDLGLSEYLINQNVSNLLKLKKVVKTKTNYLLILWNITTNHHLPIEKGRHLGIERTCTHCHKNIIGTEIHYFLEKKSEQKCWGNIIIVTKMLINWMN